MATRLTPIGWIAKFVVVPAAFVAVGFYLVGPRIGANKSASKSTSTANEDAPSSSQATPPQASTSDSPPSAAPSGVEVTTKPATEKPANLGHDSDANASEGAAQEETPKPRTRHRRKPVTPSEEPNLVAPPTDPTPDDGGSTGTAGAQPPKTNSDPSTGNSGHTI